MPGQDPRGPSSSEAGKVKAYSFTLPFLGGSSRQWQWQPIRSAQRLFVSPSVETCRTFRRRLIPLLPVAYSSVRADCPCPEEESDSQVTADRVVERGSSMRCRLVCSLGGGRLSPLRQLEQLVRARGTLPLPLPSASWYGRPATPLVRFGYRPGTQTQSTSFALSLSLDALRWSCEDAF